MMDLIYLFVFGIIMLVLTGIGVSYEHSIDLEKYKVCMSVAKDPKQCEKKQ